MLGKQWLNRYASTDMRGTTIERSQNRQRKLDGIVAWYFDHVMGSLPLMLQAALLLLGCALSHYLWGINATVASVVIGVTASGVIFYLFIVAAGVASESCPYQTPGSHAFRYLRRKVRIILRSATSVIRDAFRKSKTARTVNDNVWWYHPWWSRGKIKPFLKDMVLEVPRAIAIDAYHFGRVMVWSFTAGVYNLGSVMIIPLVSRLRGTPSTPGQESDQQLIVLDLRCISWMLQTSLDKAIHLSTLKHLTTMMPLTNFDPALIAHCLNTFVGCININNCKVVITRGLEHLATVSAVCFLRTFYQLSTMNPTSSVLEGVRQRHDKVFPLGTDFRGLPWYYMMAKAYGLTNQCLNLRYTWWDNYRPSPQQHIPFTWGIAEAAQVAYQGTQCRKVPRWILRFTLRSLSLDPPPPTSVIADCLSIIAIDLGCDISSIGTTSANRCVCI